MCFWRQEAQNRELIVKNASRPSSGPAFFCAQVLDFYRRPMLYYYNDCEYVHFQHGGLRGEKLFGYRRGSPEQDTI